MKNNSPTADTAQVNPLPLDRILKEIHNQLLFWIAGLSMITFAFVLLLSIEKSNEFIRAGNQQINFSEYSFGKYNQSLISRNKIGLLFTFIVAGWFCLFIVGGARVFSKPPLEKWQLQIFILVSVILVIIYIFVTGGILDSPFTSALSIYVGGFLILQERTDTKKFNNCLIGLTILFLCIPYFVLYFSSCDLFFFSWNTENSPITTIRLLVVLLVTGFSILQADRINKKIEKIYNESEEHEKTLQQNDGEFSSE